MYPNLQENIKHRGGVCIGWVIRIDNRMFEGIYKPSVTRAPTSYGYYNVSRNLLTPKQRRFKLIAVVLARAVQRSMRQTWQQLWQPERRMVQRLSRVVALTEKNASHSVLLGFERVKRAAVAGRGGERLLRSVVNWLQRMEKYKLKTSFGRLVLGAFRGGRQALATFYEQRDYSFCRKLQALAKRKKRQVLQAMFRYARFVKSYSKVRVVAVIHGRFMRALKQSVFGRLQRVVLARTRKPQVEREVRELKVALQDMTVQLQNKNDNIQRLEEELNQIKVEQSNLSFNQNLSYGESGEKGKKNGSFKSYSLKKIGSVNNTNNNNDSADNVSLGDMSIGSLLGNLNRSRNGSVSKYDPNCDCACGFRAKYVKYKSLNQSLKNQLQIVKEELEVAKDLNEHFTNEIKQYLSGETGDGDYEKLKKEHSLLMEERDQLRDKVFKYQKHISGLKSQFKVKMEELYRKVRKDM